MGRFWNQQGKACANEGLLYVKGQFWRTVFKLSVNRKLLVCEKGKLFQPTQSHPIKEKLFSTHKIPTSHRTKLTCSSPFRIALAAVSLQYNNSFSKNYGLALAVQPPFRTDSNPHRRYAAKLQFPVLPVTWWMPVTLATIMYRAEIWIVPGVQRFANLWRAFWFFLHDAKRT